MTDIAMGSAAGTEQVRIWAGLQGFVSLAALVALVLFFTLATPFSTPQPRWSWLGPVNDWLAVIGAVPWIVAMVLLARHLTAGPWLWALTVLACIGAAAIAIVTLLMLGGLADLQAQTIVSVVATVVAFAWAAVAAVVAREAGVLPAWLAVLAIAITAALVATAIAGGIGFLAPDGSALRSTLFGVAVVLGGLAWIAFPVWWLAIASNLRCEAPRDSWRA
ncbi:hypothetical protein GCM10017608_26980 [Agromyces luteolus]|uniref:Uncharacterized protein n=1 Tax=Agromyces luteolus TaxID=88373 RepID=A0A7C9MH30_9MICO|nr:hypothetical protein [Agromyces luteolus]MUN06938.1 hypothetical protein [Agromyces luteolus]GLK28763.1 hypothetical protein GCM10017608_26980 [Agromyces luteolus]